MRAVRKEDLRETPDTMGVQVSKQIPDELLLLLVMYAGITEGVPEHKKPQRYAGIS